MYSYEVSNDEISKFKLLFTIWFSFKHYKKIKDIIRKNSIDIVHVHNFYPLLTPSVFKAAKKAGAKVVHTLHNYRLWCISGILYKDNSGICELCTKRYLPLDGVMNRCYRNSFIQSMLAQASFSMYKLLNSFRHIDYYFVLTEFQKQKVMSLGISEAKIILKPNSLNPIRLTQTRKNGYVFVGRLEASKGIFTLLDTWCNLDEKHTLTIIGGGPLESDLRKKYQKENIVFKGRCSREETLSIISKSKYLIQSSLWYETFGLTIIEAMSQGTPVIGFDIGTRRDFIENDYNGFLSNQSSFTDTIQKSFEYTEYKKLSEGARKTAASFANEKVIKDQIDIYQRILDVKDPG